eukprot:11103835-Prorocentrum_lima.AAC.1
MRRATSPVLSSTVSKKMLVQRRYSWCGRRLCPHRTLDEARVSMYLQKRSGQHQPTKSGLARKQPGL